ncbi:MAG: hypothetical protein VX607_04705, partial [Planctomycetota bacterium]|nr:hypothetical protein [Planctomycetota bacterium]
VVHVSCANQGVGHWGVCEQSLCLRSNPMKRNNQESLRSRKSKPSKPEQLEETARTICFELPAGRLGMADPGGLRG